MFSSKWSPVMEKAWHGIHGHKNPFLDRSLVFLYTFSAFLVACSLTYIRMAPGHNRSSEEVILVCLVGILSPISFGWFTLVVAKRLFYYVMFRRDCWRMLKLIPGAMQMSLSELEEEAKENLLDLTKDIYRDGRSHTPDNEITVRIVWEKQIEFNRRYSVFQGFDLLRGIDGRYFYIEASRLVAREDRSAEIGSR